MRRGTKYTIAGVVAIVAGFALIYYFFLRGTQAGDAIKAIVRPRIRGLAQETERTDLEVAKAYTRTGRGLSREAEDMPRGGQRTLSAFARKGGGSAFGD
jgi:hypothetical protein